MNSLIRTCAALMVALTFGLAGCATVQKVDAADDVHAFLSAIRDNDRALFEAHVDRDAIRRQLTGRITDAAGQAGASPALVATARLMSNASLGLAGQALIQPQVFRGVGEMFGYSSKSPLPGKLAIATVLRYQSDGQVCAPLQKGGACVLVFVEREGVWRLSGFEGDLRKLAWPGR